MATFLKWSGGIIVLGSIACGAWLQFEDFGGSVLNASTFFRLQVILYTLAPAGIGLLVMAAGYVIELLEVHWSPVRAFPSFDDESESSDF